MGDPSIMPLAQKYVSSLSTLPPPSREYELRRLMSPHPLGSAFNPQRMNMMQMRPEFSPVPQAGWRRMVAGHPQGVYSYEHPTTLTSTVSRHNQPNRWGVTANQDTV